MTIGVYHFRSCIKTRDGIHVATILTYTLNMVAKKARFSFQFVPFQLRQTNRSRNWGPQSYGVGMGDDFTDKAIELETFTLC